MFFLFVSLFLVLTSSSIFPPQVITMDERLVLNIHDFLDLSNISISVSHENVAQIDFEVDPSFDLVQSLLFPNAKPTKIIKVSDFYSLLIFESKMELYMIEKNLKQTLVQTLFFDKILDFPVKCLDGVGEKQNVILDCNADEKSVFLEFLVIEKGNYKQMSFVNQFVFDIQSFAEYLNCCERKIRLHNDLIIQFCKYTSLMSDAQCLGANLECFQEKKCSNEALIYRRKGNSINFVLTLDEFSINSGNFIYVNCFSIKKVFFLILNYLYNITFLYIFILKLKANSG